MVWAVLSFVRLCPLGTRLGRFGRVPQAGGYLPAFVVFTRDPPPAEQLEFLVLEPNPSLLWPLMSVFLPKGWLYADGKVGTARALRIGSAQRGVE